jgi:hypothetical protein
MFLDEKEMCSDEQKKCAEERKKIYALLTRLYQRGIKPWGLIKLEETCVLEAFFGKGRGYDAFNVRDSSALKAAIEKVCPAFVASLVRSALHMTIHYPSRVEAPGISSGDQEVFSCGREEAVVLLYVNEIHVDRGASHAAAVVSGIDTPALFASPALSNGRPAHLTLWAMDNNRAGMQLIGKALSLRTPFMEVSRERMMALIKAQQDTIETGGKTICLLEPFVKERKERKGKEKWHLVGFQDRDPDYTMQELRRDPHPELPYLPDLLTRLYQRGIQPWGLIKLEETCVLEAFFGGGRGYNAFHVRDSSALKAAIEKVCPAFVASLVRSVLHLHMTVDYRVETHGTSSGDQEVFSCGREEAVVLLYVNEIHVDRGSRRAAAVVSGIDTPAKFQLKSADIHLALWECLRIRRHSFDPFIPGTYPFNQNLSWTQRSSFMKVTDELLRSIIKRKRDKIESQNKKIALLRFCLHKQLSSLTIISDILEPKLFVIQAAVRRWLTYLHSDRLRRMSGFTPWRRILIMDFMRRWKKAARIAHQQYINDMYDDYDEY